MVNSNPRESTFCALGDSITSVGYYHNYAHLFYTLRFPEKPIDFANAGVSGDTAAGALRRLSWDVLTHAPDTVSIMFGMNDIGGANYAPGAEGPAIEEARKRQQDAYEHNLRSLVQSLTARGIRPILITPSIYDDTVDLETPNNPGRNQGLAKFADLVKQMGAELQLEVVDFHGPMQELNAKRQAQDPTFTLVGKDRVHPEPPGHLVMAYLFLKAQGVSGEVATVSIQGEGGKLQKAANCKVEGIRKTDQGIAFRYTANALPFPVENAAAPALEWIPFLEECNREILAVSDLPPGAYELKIDGQTIRTYPAEELANGVNLAAESQTPQYQQALEVLELFKKRWAAVGRLRTNAFVEHGACPELPRPLTLDQLNPKIDAWVATAKGKPYEDFYQGSADTCRLDKPLENEIDAEIAQLLPEIRRAAVPKSREVTLTQAGI